MRRRLKPFIAEVNDMIDKPLCEAHPKFSLASHEGRVWLAHD